MLFRCVILVGIFALSGCAEPRLFTLTGPNPGEVTDILVATSRGPSIDPELMFEGERSDQLSYYALDISVPPIRKAGEIRYPTQNPDPQRDFLAINQTNLDTERRFRAAIDDTLRNTSQSDQTVFLFVHGYNVSHPEAVFRAAQLRVDLNIEGPTVLYSWPSAGRISRYAYDRDSALFAREGLAELLTTLSQTRAKNIIILAHSMGTAVTLEALRTLSLSGNDRVLDRIQAVMLAQPDIDNDVFRRQILSTNRPDIPILITCSEHDYVLWVSSIITGGHPRVGGKCEKDALGNIGILAIDTAEINDGAFNGHEDFATSPTMLSILGSDQLGQALREGDPGGSILLQGVANASFAVAYLPVLIFAQ